MMRIFFAVFCWCVSALVSAQSTRVELLFLGDIMQHDSQIAAAYQKETGEYDYSDCFRWIAPHLRAADLTIGNLELTLAGPPYKGYPQFSAPDALVRDLKKAGVDVLVTANNHSMDRGKVGVERTIEILERERIPATGTFKDSVARAQHYPLLIEKNGFRISLLNYTYGTNGIAVTPPNIVNRIDTVQIMIDLGAARLQKPDLVVVFFHWGSEYQSQPTAWQKTLRELCFREGAQLVVGAHPHVLQPMEWYREKNQVVAYSLGNFVSGQRPRYRDGGATLRVTLRKNDVDSVPKTIVENAEYHLQWVHRDSRQRYFVLPAADFQADTVLLSTTASRESLNLFLKDSRDLFSKFNRAVAEDSAAAFRVWISGDSTLDPNPLLDFYQTQRANIYGENAWVTAEFPDADTAIRAAHDIGEKTPYHHAAVLRLARRKD